MSIESEWERYQTTPAYKQKVAQALAQKKHSVTTKYISILKQKLNEMFARYMVYRDTKQQFITADDLITTIKITEKNTIVDLNFNPAKVRRESLYVKPDGGGRTGKGVDNIVALFNNGISKKPDVRPVGYWESHQKMVTAVFDRPYTGFMKMAVDGFNASAKKGVVATLNEKYK